MKFYYGEKGFSLVELSVVLVVVGLLLGGIIGSMESFINLARSKDVEKNLDLMRDAIVGFAIQNGRLPCADSDGDGIENGPPACAQWGTVPYATLAVERRDAWGGDYLYRVDTSFADEPTGTDQSSFSLVDLGNITVRDSADLAVANTVAVEIPVIVVSQGPNRGSGSDDEDENIDDNNSFVQREYSNSPGSEFDDKLMWISPLVLKAKMLEVGKLP